MSSTLVEVEAGRLPVVPARPPTSGNLNLGALRTLGVLLQERSVIRAATLLNVTPQAVSQTLARLREVFDDPLLVRAATGYEPTARAVALRPMLETTLTAMRRILQSDEADPRSFRGTVNLGVAKYAIGARFERALPRLLREAPGIAFRMHHLPAAGLEQVETGEVDVAISLAKSKSANVYRALLERGRWLCVMRRDHPLACASGLDAYLSAQHLVILEAQDGYDAVDRALSGLGKERQVALRTPSRTIAATVLAESDLVLTVPQWMSDSFRRSDALVVGSPLDFLPDAENTLFWHMRVQHAPLYVWVRRFLIEQLRDRSA